MKSNDKSKAAFCYSMNLLNYLLKMTLITQDEYAQIMKVSSTHYGAEEIYV